MVLAFYLTSIYCICTYIFYFSIKRGHHKIQRKPLRSMWTPQYIRYTLIGHSLLPLVVFLKLYICSLIVYATMMNDSCEKDDDESKEVSKKDFFWPKFLKNLIRIPGSSEVGQSRVSNQNCDRNFSRILLYPPSLVN